MEPIKPMKLMVYSLTSFVIYVSIIHTAWYLFREKYVPKHQQRDTPITLLYKNLTRKNTEKKNDKN